jgi:ubiquinone/menaquinone biosynthesis C-methylase UbiE
MRWLESSPERYDAGMRIVTFGRVTPIHDAVARAAAPEPGRDVLEIGCGTGAVTERLLARGAKVTALDQSPAMLEQARRRLAAVPPERVRWLERTASEIDSLPAASFDAVVASLSLSEMGAAERRFVLRESLERLRPGAVLVVADEVRPARRWQRVGLALLRAPQVALAWLLAGSVSRPLKDLPGELRGAGFALRSERRWLLGSLGLFEAVRP